jgi:hypothetical protein
VLRTDNFRQLPCTPRKLNNSTEINRIPVVYGNVDGDERDVIHRTNCNGYPWFSQKKSLPYP